MQNFCRLLIRLGRHGGARSWGFFLSPLVAKERALPSTKGNEMNERDDTMLPAATRAVIGNYNKPSVQERGIDGAVDAYARQYYPGQYEKFFRPFLEKKRTQSGHARD